MVLGVEITKYLILFLLKYYYVENGLNGIFIIFEGLIFSESNPSAVGKPNEPFFVSTQTAKSPVEIYRRLSLQETFQWCLDRFG